MCDSPNDNTALGIFLGKVLPLMTQDSVDAWIAEVYAMGELQFLWVTNPQLHLQKEKNRKDVRNFSLR